MTYYAIDTWFSDQDENVNWVTRATDAKEARANVRRAVVEAFPEDSISKLTLLPKSAFTQEELKELLEGETTAFFG